MFINTNMKRSQKKTFRRINHKSNFKLGIDTNKTYMRFTKQQFLYKYKLPREETLAFLPIFVKALYHRNK